MPVRAVSLSTRVDDDQLEAARYRITHALGRVERRESRNASAIHRHQRVAAEQHPDVRAVEALQTAHERAVQLRRDDLVGLVDRETGVERRRADPRDPCTRKRKRERTLVDRSPRVERRPSAGRARRCSGEAQRRSRPARRPRRSARARTSDPRAKAPRRRPSLRELIRKIPALDAGEATRHRMLAIAAHLLPTLTALDIDVDPRTSRGSSGRNSYGWARLRLRVKMPRPRLASIFQIPLPSSGNALKSMIPAGLYLGHQGRPGRFRFVANACPIEDSGG